MFAEITPLEETVSYKEIFAKGEIKGKIKGEIKGKAEGRYETITEELERLSLLHSQNVLTEPVFKILANPLKKELEHITVLLLQIFLSSSLTF